MGKLLKRILALGMAGIMALPAAQPAMVTHAEDQLSVYNNESEITQYMDCFRPMPVIGGLTEDCWGAADVGARDQSNGLEDREMKDYCYWDGSIVKDEETGKYYMFASRWAQNGGHWGSEYDGNLGWRGSQAIRAVSDSLYGPYVDEGPLWPDYCDGVGHNVFCFKLSEKDPVYKDYKYAISVSDVGTHGDEMNGTLHLSDSLTGTWKHIGKINVDEGQFRLSNISIMVRPDGRYEAIGRDGDIAVADSIMGPWEVADRKLWWKVPGMSSENIEDPVIWYSDGLYHCVVNKWDARYAYYLTSQDGIHNWTLHPGTAYTPDVEFLSYEDGTMNNWTKLERPNVYIENGTLTAMTFAVIDVQKEDDLPNDSHGSKVIVVPFAGDKLGEFATRKDALESRKGILPAEDANVQSYYEEAGKNYGAEAYLQLQRNTEQGLFGEGERPYDWYDCKIGYLKYDLSEFDLREDGEDIDRAYLSLVYMDKPAGEASWDQIQVSLAESEWTEGSGREETNGNYTDDGVLTWWNQPKLIYDPNDIEHTTAVSDTFSLADTQKEVTVDVTNLLKQFKKDGSNENILSLALSETASGNRIQIGSKEAGEKYAAKLAVYKKQEKKITSVDPVQVDTTAGKLPQMPSNVSVTYSDGTKGSEEVKWEINEKDLTSLGVVKVRGKIPGYSVETEAVINVRYAVCASDLAWTEQTQGNPVKNRTAGGNELKARMGKLNLPVSYEKGIGTRAPSQTVYDITGKGYERFQANISLGYDYGQNAKGAVIFKVFVDDEAKPRYTSPVMTYETKCIPIDVDIRGASRIRLVTEAADSQTGQEYNVADWCGAKFVSAHAAAEKILWDGNPFIYLERGEMPKLPETAEVRLKDGNTGIFHVEWPKLTAEMFQEPAVKKITGTVTGTEAASVTIRAVVDYNNAMKLPETAGKIGNYDICDTFAYVPGVDEKMGLNQLKENGALNPGMSLLCKWTENLLIENCTGHGYGFDYGVYPDPNSANPEYLVIRAPYITSFAVRGTANSAEAAEKEFAFSTSSDGDVWTEFTDCKKTDDTSDGGWPSRLYAADNLPENTHYIKIAFPAGSTWEFNLNKIQVTGGKAEEETVYTVEMDANGGVLQAEGPITIEKGGKIGELPIPQKTGERFIGWYTAREGGEKITSSYVPKESMTIYAHWEKRTQPPAAEPADKKALKSTVNNMKKIALKKYTAASVSAFRKALSRAEEVLADGEATQGQTDAALRALQKAKAGLKMKVPASGTTFNSGIFKYKVTKSHAKKGTVTVYKLLKQRTRIAIPATVKKDGYTFKVTAISRQAFQKNKKLKSVVIGANITSIGSRSFYDCQKLQTITFQGKNAPKIGSRAFSGIKAKCKVTVPKKMTKKQWNLIKTRMKKGGIGKKTVYKKK